MTTLIAIAMAATSGPTFDLKFVPSGMTAKMGGYRPIRAEMKPAGEGVKKAPDGLKAPGYGVITIPMVKVDQGTVQGFQCNGRSITCSAFAAKKGGDHKFGFILDEPAGADPKLYVDSNGNGDYTDDPATKWATKTTNGATMASGSFQVSLGEQLATLNAYRFDKNDKNRAQLANTLLYYYDFGFEGTGTFGDQKYPVAFAGMPSAESFVWVDRNSNKKSDGAAESIAPGKPFNFGGKSFVLNPAGGSFEVAASEKEVAEIPLPPDLSAEKLAPAFEAVATDGTKISFPGSYKHRLVMIDFWATWCGPCIAEMPNVKAAYKKFHAKGFEILGVSFDQENAAEKLATFTKENDMPWQQIYEGKFWETKIGRQYGIQSIPMAVLVDGDSGKIIASGNALRGEGLDKILAKMLGG